LVGCIVSIEDRVRCLEMKVADVEMKCIEARIQCNSLHSPSENSVMKKRKRKKKKTKRV